MVIFYHLEDFLWNFPSGILALFLELPGWKYNHPLLSFYMVPWYEVDIPGRNYVALHLYLIIPGRVLLSWYVSLWIS